jgi:MFS family permease
MKRLRLSKRLKIFYGYWIVVATFFCLFITSGFGFFAFSLFVKPLQGYFGWGRGEIMTAFTIYLLVMGMTSPFIGRLIARYEARKVIATGALAVGLGFISLSQINSLRHFYFSYAVIGVGMAAIGHIPSSAIVSNWFEKRRGTTIGIMSTGIGAGGFVMAPIIGGFLIPNYDWSVSYLVLAVVTWALIIPLALFVIRTKPADIGLYPDGRQAPETAPATEAQPFTANGLSLRMALATSGFWLAAVSYLTGGFSSVGIVQNQVPYLEDIGLPVAMVAGTLSGVGLGSLIGKFSFGWLCDRIAAKYAFSIALVLQAAGIILLMSIKPVSPPAIIWLYVAMIGLGVGGWLPTMSMLVSTNFGLAAYGTIYGMVNLAQSIGVATGPLLMGYIYDIMGTYQSAFIILLSLYAIAIPAILAVRRPKSPRNLRERISEAG